MPVPRDLECYLPEFMEVNISRDELAGIYDGLVVPVLHEMLDRGRGAEWQYRVSRRLPIVARHRGIARETVREMEESIVAAFGSFGLGVEAVGTIEGPQVTRVRLKPGHRGSKLHRWRTARKTCRWLSTLINRH